MPKFLQAQLFAWAGDSIRKKEMRVYEKDRKA
jgi:hypothetical protein